MDADTLEMLQTSLAHVLTEDGGASLADRLDALGWDEVLADDAPTALRVLFEIKGETLSSSDALGPVLAGAMAEVLDDDSVVDGAVVVLPASLHPNRLSSTLDGDRVVADGVVLESPDDGATMVVPVAGQGSSGPRLALVGPEARWSFQPLPATDPSLGLTRASTTVEGSNVRWVDDDVAAAAWEAASARARWTLAAELAAIGRHVVDHAVAYTRDRKQYGRPIGSFQAVQHRLASAHVTVAGASALVAEASASGSPWAALVAKAVAGQAAEAACTQAQQAYGAIGFTWEHDFHRYLRRTYVLDWLFGDWRTLEREIGRHLLETQTVPRIGHL
jgi:Acyl-CoA dehydrogenase, C-terminal domain